MLLAIIILVVASCIIWFIAKGISAFFFADGHADAGLRAEFRYARSAKREGDLKEAIRLAQQELEKDPKNYEGLLLLAAIYEEMKIPDQAMLQLNAALSHPDVTDAQREFAQAEKDRLEQAQNRSSAVPPPLPQSVTPPPFPKSIEQ
jgi:tetratricopeptide (TPR) repeat protein